MIFNMNLDDEKQLWQNAGDDGDWRQNNLRRYWSHPNLRSLRRQLIFETICWALFLSFYYGALDGHLRDNGWNIALAVGLVALIIHGVVGYQLAGKPIGDAPLRMALQQQLDELKLFRWLSIFLRTTGLVCFFGFMVSNVPFLKEAPRLWLAGTIMIWTIVALAVNYFIWRSHFKKMEATLAELEE